jgi:hypothetical protein
VTTADDRFTAALRAEYAALFAYGVIGAHLDAKTVAQGRSAELAHRSRRDALLVRLSANGLTPPGAEPAYALPFPVATQADAIKLAVRIEELTAAFWREALGDTVDEARKVVLDALVNCAVQATRWRRLGAITPSTVPFPGVTG